MAKTITVTQAEFDKRAKEIAQKSFMLGVDWMCKVLVDSDVFEFDKLAADLFHKRAQAVIQQSTE